MVRMAITIPEVLKARMDERTDIDWNNVAEQAFRNELGREAFRSGPAPYDEAEIAAAAQRLSRERDEYWKNLEKLTRQKGFFAGAKWARNRAHFSELTSLDHAVYLLGVDQAAEHFAVAITGGTELIEEELIGLYQRADETTPNDFWDAHIGLSPQMAWDYYLAKHSQNFRVGFVEGAQRLWDIIVRNM